MPKGEHENRWLASAARRGDAYDHRFQELCDQGVDVHGEAHLVASFGPKSVLDAGCGTGRVAIELDRLGFDVAGVDIDERMLDVARRKAPQLCWERGDLAEINLGSSFDLVVMAGNVMIFLAPSSEGAVISNMAKHLGPGGLLVAGFSLGAGLGLDDYDQLAHSARLQLLNRWATWDKEPLKDGSNYAVSVHRREPS